MNIDFERLRLLLLPSMLRGSELLNAMVAAVMQGVSSVYAMVLQYIGKERRERSYNSQVINLRRAVADLLGIDIGSVNIYDVEDIEPLYIYRMADNRDVLISSVPTCLHTESNIRYSKTFVVEVSADYQLRDTEIKTIVNKYKMVTSRFTIKYI